MQLVALVQHPDHVCCRYRLRAFQQHLSEAGHTLVLRTLPRSWWSRWALFRQLRGASVLIQRQLLPCWQLQLLRRTVRHLLFDFDDAIWMRDSYHPAGHAHPRNEQRFRETVLRCDVVIAGNDFLAAKVRNWIAADRVRVIPTCVEATAYPQRSANFVSDGKTLVWIGSSSTLQGLEAFAPLLDELGRSIPGLRLKVICDRFPQFPHLPVLRCPWEAATEKQHLADSDIGISWIPNDPWSRGKCGLKVLQYMAASLPVVANPVGVHGEMIEPGQTGYLATTFEQWHAAVVQLVFQAELRQRLGRAGRERLECRYTTAAGARAWIRLLEELPTSVRQAG
jgi:glycosyltransferase involved in cell wall biosynthesis